jgi:hypothetical protein
MASFLEHMESPAPGSISKSPVRMQISHDTVVDKTAMENRWKGVPAGKRGTEREALVFYKDMRFWLILLMLAAFFVFTLVRFP